MGCFTSRPSEQFTKETEKNRALKERLAQEHAEEKEKFKLLLLGAGESGKSTLLKQIVHLFGSGYTKEQRQSYREIIVWNLLESFKVLIGNVDPQTGLDATAAAEAKAINEMEETMGIQVLESALAARLKALWGTEGIQDAYSRRDQIFVLPSIGYFMEQIDTMVGKDFTPSVADICQTRVRTTGIVENTFEMSGNIFKIYDVGGQRNERRKWIHCFEGVTAVLFVAALSEYDQKMFEDHSTNRMTDSIELFKNICNQRWFYNTSMILFLNKRDLFQQKIKKVPLTTCWPKYDGPPGDYDAGVAFIQQRFEEQRESDKPVYVHPTCATDTTSVNMIFLYVKDTIITEYLNDSGLNFE